MKNTSATRFEALLARVRALTVGVVATAVVASGLVAFSAAPAHADATVPWADELCTSPYGQSFEVAGDYEVHVAYEAGGKTLGADTDLRVNSIDQVWPSEGDDAFDLSKTGISGVEKSEASTVTDLAGDGTAEVVHFINDGSASNPYLAAVPGGQDGYEYADHSIWDKYGVLPDAPEWLPVPVAKVTQSELATGEVIVGEVEGAEEVVLATYDSSHGTLRVDVVTGSREEGGRLENSVDLGADFRRTVPGITQLAVTTGDFDNDRVDDIGLAYTTGTMTYLEVLRYEDGADIKVSGLAARNLVPVAEGNDDIVRYAGEMSHISVVAGDLDRDFEEDLVLTWDDSHNRETFVDSIHLVRVEAYMLNNDVLKHMATATVKADSMNVGDLGAAHEQSPYAVTAGDLDGDAVPEVIVALDSNGVQTTVLSGLREQNESPETFDSLHEYDVVASFPYALEEIAQHQFSNYRIGSTHDALGLSATAGDVDRDGTSEVVIAIPDGHDVHTLVISMREEELTTLPVADPKPLIGAGESREVSVHLADRDDDSYSASLGAPAYDQPTCFDSAESEIVTSMQTPPFWSDYKGNEDGWTAFGKTSTLGVTQGESFTSSRTHTGMWRLDLTYKQKMGFVSTKQSVSYWGSKSEISEAGRSRNSTISSSLEQGYHATRNTLGQLDYAVRCFNYSVQAGKGTVYEDVPASTVADIAVIDATGNTNPDGTLHFCFPRSGSSMTNTSESFDSWEESGSAYRLGSDVASRISSKFALVRPDWSSESLFRGDWATQSSTLEGGGGEPWRAVDGNLVRSSAGSTLTKIEDKPWWQIDMGVSRYINGVRIFAPTRECHVSSCEGEKAWLGNVVVLLSDQDLSEHPQSADPVELAKLDGVVAYAWRDWVGMQLGFATYVGSRPVEARYVRVQRLDDDVRLALTEVQVFGDAHIQPHEFPSAVDNAVSVPAEYTPPAGMYRVEMYNKYKKQYEWVHVRGTLKIDPFAMNGEAVPYQVGRGTGRDLKTITQTYETGWSESYATGTQMVHGASASVGVSFDPEIEEPATGLGFGGGVSAEGHGGYENIHRQMSTESNGMTVSREIAYGSARAGFLDHVDNKIDEVTYPAACTYAYLPFTAEHSDESNGGFEHRYFDVNYIVPKNQLDRNQAKWIEETGAGFAACNVGSYGYNPNTRPVAGYIAEETAPGVPIDIDVLEHASDPDTVRTAPNDPSTAKEFSRLTVNRVWDLQGELRGTDGSTAMGTLELLDAGTLQSGNKVTSIVRYTPPEKIDPVTEKNVVFTGEVTFKYEVTDGLATNENTVKITIGAAPPTTSPDSGEAVMWGSTVINVVNNDDDLHKRPLKLVGVSKPSHGDATFNSETGEVTYTPTGSAAPDSFVYEITNGYESASGEVSITNTWDAFKNIEVEGGDLSSADVERSDQASGAEVNGLDQGAFAALAPDGAAAVERVDFGDTTDELKVVAQVAAPAGESGGLEVLVDGEVVTTVPFVGKGEGTWSTVSALAGKVSGLHEVTVRNASSGSLSSDVDWVKFATASLKPIAVDDTATVVLGASGVVDVLENDGNDYGHPLSVEIHTQPRDGTVSVDPDTGNIEYVALNNSHNDTFYYTVSDGEYEDIGRVDIVKKWDAYNLIEGEGGTEVGIMGSFPNVTQDPDASGWVNGEFGGAYVQLTSSPLYGLVRFYAVEFGAGSPTTLDLKVKGDEAPLEVLLDGAPIATVDLKADGVGPDTWRTVTVPLLEGITGEHDVQIDGGSSNVYLDWIRFNDGDIDPDPVVLAPTAADDTASVVRGESVVVGVLENDADPNQPALPLTVTAVTQGAHGTVTLDADGVVSYAASGTGTAVSDSFTYTVSNGTESATATVSMSITDPDPVVLAPTAADDTASVVRGESVVVGVLENDADPNQPALPLTVTAVTQGAHGTVTLDADGVVSYAASGTGTAVADSFTYTVSNGTESATATVSVTITDPAVAEPPTPKDDAVKVVRGGSARVHVLSNDSDPKGLTLAVSDVTQGSHGAVTLGADGVVTYSAPDTGDADSFTYTVTNGAESATATVSVSILDPALAESPTPVDDTVSVVRGKSVTVNVLANDTDPLDLSLAVTDVTQGSHGAVSFDADGVVTYTAPATGDADSFTYTVTNGAESATATVSVSILDPTTVKAPVAVYDIAKRVPSELTTIDVLKNDSDPQRLALTVTKLTQPALGTVTLNADGTLSYVASDFVPMANGGDRDSFTYTVSNGEKTATAVVWVCGCY